MVDQRHRHWSIAIIAKPSARALRFDLRGAVRSALQVHEPGHRHRVPDLASKKAACAVLFQRGVVVRDVASALQMSEGSVQTYKSSWRRATIESIARAYPHDGDSQQFVRSHMGAQADEDDAASFASDPAETARMNKVLDELGIPPADDLVDRVAAMLDLLPLPDLAD